MFQHSKHSLIDSELYPCLPTEPEPALSVIRNTESCQIQIRIMKTRLKLNVKA